MWSEVEGKTMPGMWTVGARTLPYIITNQANTSPSNEQGPDYRVNYSYPVSWERCSERGGLLKRPRTLPLSVMIFCSSTAYIHTTKFWAKVLSRWMECNFQRHKWVDSHSSGHPAVAVLATQPFPGVTITVLKGHYDCQHIITVSKYCHHAYCRPCCCCYWREFLQRDLIVKLLFVLQQNFVTSCFCRCSL